MHTLEDLKVFIDDLPEHYLRQPIRIDVGDYEVVWGESFEIGSSYSSNIVIQFHKSDSTSEVVHQHEIEDGTVLFAREGFDSREDLSIEKYVGGWKRQLSKYLVEGLNEEFTDTRFPDAVQFDDEKISIALVDEGLEYIMEPVGEPLELCYRVKQRVEDGEAENIGTIQYDFDEGMSVVLERSIDFIKERADEALAS